MGVPADDRTLVAAAQTGDRDALEALLRRHHDRVLAVCRRLTGNPADAADAAQETLLAIVRGLPRFDGRSAVSTWIFRIATNACLDELRRRGRRATPIGALTIEAGDVPRADAGAAAHLDAVVDRLDLDAALQTLPDEHRAALVLRDVADLDYAEIASMLDIPLGTVKSRIARARAALAAAVRGGNPAPTTERPMTAP
jgi:RNA polymerase sigma-70 factor (ECF subfamily)